MEKIKVFGKYAMIFGYLLFTTSLLIDNVNYNNYMFYASISIISVGVIFYRIYYKNEYPRETENADQNKYKIKQNDQSHSNIIITEQKEESPKISINFHNVNCQTKTEFNDELIHHITNINHIKTDQDHKSVAQ